MKRLKCRKAVFIGSALAALGVASLGISVNGETPKSSDSHGAAVAESTEVPSPRPIAPFVDKGIDWIVKAQHKDGGWGAGSHANQQNRDPRKVKVDPATTAFVASALLRIGNTPTEGEHKTAVRRATTYLVEVVEKYDKSGPKITDLTGTQIQSKLGPIIDTVMTTQYLARVLPKIDDSDPLYLRVDKALEKCLAKLEGSQEKDGSWKNGGWAPVLQSAQATSALEIAGVAGKQVDKLALDKARTYQKGNFNRKTGSVKTDRGAGVALYALSGSQRANAAESRAANDLIDKAKKDGRLEADADVSVSNLKKIGVKAEKARKLAEAAISIKAQNKQIVKDEVLRGFGNNGGEEYLSFLQTSESLVIVGGNEWNEWNDKMHARLIKAQSKDGSWSGHHCITSPVFCTAAVVQCLTTDHDAETLIAIATKATEADMDGEKIATALKPK